MYWFMNKNKGAISIFLIIILMASFLLGGFFIDASRILVAQRKVRMAANTAARSTLAHYDTDLVGEYGLYGINKDDVDGLFKKYFELNMTKGMSDDIKLYKYKIVDSGAEGTKLLSDGENLKNQIAEYEKYRAPVNFMIGLVNKLKGVMSGLSGSAKLGDDGANAIKNFKQSYNYSADLVKESLNGMGKKFGKDVCSSLISFTEKQLTKGETNSSIQFLTEQQVNDAFSTLDAQVDKISQNIGSMRNAKNTYSAEQAKIEADIESYKAQMVAGNTTTGENQEALSHDFSDMDEHGQAVENSGETLEQQAESKIAKLETELQNLKNDISNAKARVLQKNSEYKSAVENYNQKCTEYKNAVANSGISAQKDQKTKNSKRINDIKNEIAGYFVPITGEFCLNADVIDVCGIYKDADSTKREEIRKEVKESGRFATDVVDKLLNDTGTGIFDLYDEKTRLEAAQTAADAAITAEEQKISEQKSAMESAYNTAEEKRKALEDELNNLKSLGVNIDVGSTELKEQELKEDIKSSLSNIALLTTLKSITLDQVRTITAVSDTTDEDGTDSKNPLTVFDSIHKYITNMVNALSSFDNIRDECYMIDYIMERNTYLTSQSDYDHWFANGEVEYIIFGQKHQITNIIMAVGSIYFLRFVIDSVDYFMQVTNSPELISRIITAITRGAAQAALDVGDMVLASTGDTARGCPICPSLKNSGLMLSYSDHLRIYMLLKLGNNDRNLINAINSTLENEKKSTPINKLCTQINAHAEVEVNLIILSMFNIESLANEKFRNGSYVIKEEIVDGY